ncbi:MULTISPECIES: type II toxin-antitoxin system RelE/ParE family toxin [Rahnella]|uniref:type II toxin-antitoxin system RelE/ParE family toxin n=1 Tax=Rahnella TaxID=34037 RepID=UPI003BA03D28
MTHRVVFSPRALDQLDALQSYIEAAGSPVAAGAYVEAIIVYCESMATFPVRGVVRDDIREGLRITNYRGRAVIAFTVNTDTVAILGVFYGGQDYSQLL